MAVAPGRNIGGWRMATSYEVLRTEYSVRSTPQFKRRPACKLLATISPVRTKILVAPHHFLRLRICRIPPFHPQLFSPPPENSCWVDRLLPSLEEHSMPRLLS